jgi:hypothetical protein
VASHLQGKQHLGFIQIRKTIEELKALQESHLQNNASSRDTRDRDDRRSGSKDNYYGVGRNYDNYNDRRDNRNRSRGYEDGSRRNSYGQESDKYYRGGNSRDQERSRPY